MSSGRASWRPSPWLAVALLATAATAQPPWRLLGRSHWWIDRQGRVAAVVTAGTRHEILVDLGLGEAMVWRLADGYPVLESEDGTCRVRIAALVDPDLLVVRVTGRGRRKPFAIRWPAPTVVTADGVGLLGLDSGHKLAVHAPGCAAAVRPAGGTIVLPPTGGHLLLGAGEEGGVLVARALGLVPALADLLDIHAARWAMRGHDAVRLRSGDATLDAVFRRAVQQLLASTDADGRIWDQRGAHSVVPTTGAAVDAAAALWACGLEAWSRRVLDMAGSAADGAELRLLQARARLWRAGGRLGPAVAWEAAAVTADDTRIGRELETGHQKPAVLVPDLIELGAGGVPLPELEGAWFAAGDRFLLAADPADERVACWHLWPASRFFDLPEAWQHAVARSAPQVVAKLLQRDGTLALRAAVGRAGVPGADARPSPVATALLALWRMQRGDRTGAWRGLAAVAARQTASNKTWLPWAWDGDGSTAREASVASAALFVLATLETLARPDGDAWRVGLPDQLAACELERLHLGAGPATLRLRRAPTAVLAELVTTKGDVVRLLDDAGAPVPAVAATQAPASVLPSGRAAPLRLPATLEHLVLGGPAYQRRFVETTALLRHLGASDVEILRVRRRPSPAEEEAAIAELLRLGIAVERAFELGLRR